MHAGSKHIGKIPAGSKSRVQFEQSISELQLKLQESIEQENYEQAAQLRDQLKELEESTKTEV